MNFALSDVKRLIDEVLSNDEPTGDPFLDARYDEATRQRGEPLYYYRFFYSWCKEFKPALCVELGAWQATCAAHMAAGNPTGMVVTIDHHTDPGDEAHKAKAEEAAARYGNLVYLQSWTWDARPRVEALALPIDVLFIDSWHQYDKAMRDWEDYSPLLASPALVVADDILSGDGPVIAGMRRFWDELPGEKFLDRRLHSAGDGCYPMGFMKHRAHLDFDRRITAEMRFSAWTK